VADRGPRDLLIELGCEELPPKAVDALREAFSAAVAEGIEKAGIGFDRESSRSFSTPRRLALLLSSVEDSQPDQLVERRGPAVSAAFDADGKPTAAAAGFARSVGKEVGDLDRIETEKGQWLFCKQSLTGKLLGEVVFEIVTTALRQLPIPRPMRWSDHEFTFVRPVHWLVVLYGDEVLPGQILGQSAGRSTCGHRVHAPGPHELASADDYESTLLEARVIADPAARKQKIVEALRAEDKAVIMDPDLLDEVNNLVEWPVGVACHFDEEFLKVPHPALIASMQDHQKFFPVGADAEGTAITNRFVAVSNLESTDFTQVRSGYERVIRPRLADARFFLEQDEKKPLADYAPKLDDIVYQDKIGTTGDKTRRIVEISQNLADFLGIDAADSTRAASLCKCDLVTQMVGEFPELQGVMGGHYARVSGEAEAVAQAISEHYAPSFAGDDIPTTDAGRVVSTADRIDTLIGIFAAGLAPSGNKDPFALRRAALGLVRILSESDWPVALEDLISWASESLAEQLQCDEELQGEVKAFIVQRARGHFREKGFGAEVVSAVLAASWKHLPDLEARLSAIDAFMGREEARSLSAANKRIGNILRKSGEEALPDVRAELLHLGEEKLLFEDISRISKEIMPLLAKSDYPASLELLAGLKQPLDAFFDTVLVMDEDPLLRRNRLAVLWRLKSLFDGIADLSVLGET